MGRAAKLASYLIPGLVALITFIVFSPALRNGFVNWDDLETLVENQNFRGFTWSHLRWMFTTFHLGHYQPLSWLTFSLDYLLWGMDAFGYHLTNILLHSANAVLFYFVTLRLLEIATPISSAVVLMLAAGFSALFFAIHPLRVESVAWATERRDVLSAFFLLLTVLSYLKAVDPEMTIRAGDVGSPCRRCFMCFLCSAKASGITLPLVLLVLDVYPLRRLGGGAGKWFGADARRVWLEKLPFFIAALAAGAVALTAQQKAGALVTTETHDLAGQNRSRLVRHNLLHGENLAAYRSRSALRNTSRASSFSLAGDFCGSGFSPDQSGLFRGQASMAGSVGGLGHLSLAVGAGLWVSPKPAYSWSRIATVICRAWFGRCFWQPCCPASGGCGLECLAGASPLFS